MGAEIQKLNEALQKAQVERQQLAEIETIRWHLDKPIECFSFRTYNYHGETQTLRRIFTDGVSSFYGYNETSKEMGEARSANQYCKLYPSSQSWKASGGGFENALQRVEERMAYCREMMEILQAPPPIVLLIEAMEGCRIQTYELSYYSGGN